MNVGDNRKSRLFREISKFQYPIEKFTELCLDGLNEEGRKENVLIDSA